MKRIRERLSYANVVATLALFLALAGGTAFAATQLAENSVGTKQIKNNAVTTAKIANNAVTGAKVKESTLGAVPHATFAGGPSAFAHVSAGGTLLAGRGGVKVKGGSTEAFYCFSGLSFSPAGAVASPDYWNGTPQFQTQLQVGLASSGGTGGTGCAAGTQVFVHGVTPSSDSPNKVGFYIVFFK